MDPVWHPEDYTWDPYSLVAQLNEQAQSVMAAIPRMRQGPEDDEETPQLNMGAGVKGPRCQVQSCGVDLSGEKAYFRRYHVCPKHLKMLSLQVEGRMCRFCQQCGRFQDVADFDDSKRSCRVQLQKHNERRRKMGVSKIITKRGGARSQLNISEVAPQGEQDTEMQATTSGDMNSEGQQVRSKGRSATQQHKAEPMPHSRMGPQLGSVKLANTLSFGTGASDLFANTFNASNSFLAAAAASAAARQRSDGLLADAGGSGSYFTSNGGSGRPGRRPLGQQPGGDGGRLPRSTSNASSSSDGAVAPTMSTGLTERLLSMSHGAAGVSSGCLTSVRPGSIDCQAALESLRTISSAQLGSLWGQGSSAAGQLQSVDDFGGLRGVGGEKRGRGDFMADSDRADLLAGLKLDQAANAGGTQDGGGSGRFDNSAAWDFNASLGLNAAAASYHSHHQHHPQQQQQHLQQHLSMGSAGQQQQLRSAMAAGEFQHQQQDLMHYLHQKQHALGAHEGGMYGALGGAGPSGAFPPTSSSQHLHHSNNNNNNNNAFGAGQLSLIGNAQLQQLQQPHQPLVTLGSAPDGTIRAALMQLGASDARNGGCSGGGGGVGMDETGTINLRTLSALRETSSGGLSLGQRGSPMHLSGASRNPFGSISEGKGHSGGGGGGSFCRDRGSLPAPFGGGGGVGMSDGEQQQPSQQLMQVYQQQQRLLRRQQQQLQQQQQAPHEEPPQYEQLSRLAYHRQRQEQLNQQQQQLSQQQQVGQQQQQQGGPQQHQSDAPLSPWNLPCGMGAGDATGAGGGDDVGGSFENGLSHLHAPLLSQPSASQDHLSLLQQQQRQQQQLPPSHQYSAYQRTFDHQQPFDQQPQPSSGQQQQQHSGDISHDRLGQLQQRVGLMQQSQQHHQPGYHIDSPQLHQQQQPRDEFIRVKQHPQEAGSLSLQQHDQQVQIQQEHQQQNGGGGLPDQAEWLSPTSTSAAAAVQPPPSSFDMAMDLAAGGGDAADYVSEDILVRLSLKMRNCTPDQLPADLRARLSQWVQHADAVVLQGFIRPGCTHLTVDVAAPTAVARHEGSLAASLLSNAAAVASLEAVLAGVSGRVDVQCGQQVAVVEDGVLTSLSCLDPGAAPVLNSVGPVAVVAGRPVLLELSGAGLGCCHARMQGQHLDMEECAPSGPPSDVDLASLHVNGAAAFGGPHTSVAASSCGVADAAASTTGATGAVSDCRRVFSVTSPLRCGLMMVECGGASSVITCSSVSHATTASLDRQLPVACDGHVLSDWHPVVVVDDPAWAAEINRRADVIGADRLRPWLVRLGMALDALAHPAAHGKSKRVPPQLPAAPSAPCAQPAGSAPCAGPAASARAPPYGEPEAAASAMLPGAPSAKFMPAPPCESSVVVRTTDGATCGANCAAVHDSDGDGLISLVDEVDAAAEPPTAWGVSASSTTVIVAAANVESRDCMLHKAAPDELRAASAAAHSVSAVAWISKAPAQPSREFAAHCVGDIASTSKALPAHPPREIAELSAGRATASTSSSAAAVAQLRPSAACGVTRTAERWVLGHMGSVAAAVRGAHCCVRSPPMVCFAQAGC